MNQQVMSFTPERTTVVGRYRWTICALLFFATTINYLDRQVLSLLAPVLTKEFGWTNTDYANIMQLVDEGKLTIAPAEGA